MLLPTRKEMKALLSKLKSMKAYDPEFNDTVTAARKALAELTVLKPRLLRTYDEEKELNKLETQFSVLVDGVKGVERHGIIWTAKHDTVGIDYRDVEHYLDVKDTLTAEDYDGVSIHYFVDGKSYRGVATAIHHELKTKVRVGKMVIDVAQVSGVLITNRPYNRIFTDYFDDKEMEVTSDMIAEPHDLFALVESSPSASLARVDTHVGARQGHNLYLGGLSQDGRTA